MPSLTHRFVIQDLPLSHRSFSRPIHPVFGPIPRLSLNLEGAPPARPFALVIGIGAVPMSKSNVTSKQLKLFKQPKLKKDHGGSLAVRKKRSRRPLNLKQSHHITMKSHHAVGIRSLFRHKKMILSLIKKNSSKFQVKVYEYALQGNHIHLLVKAQSREGLQNFFRVIAGHTAQRILKESPFRQAPGGASNKPTGCKKNQRKFWSYLLYSRIITWGKEFKLVVRYIQRNTLELLQVIAYQPRSNKLKSNKRNSS